MIAGGHSIRVRGGPIPHSSLANRPARGLSGRLWQNVTVRLAVALAFADASIVVLALPEIVPRLHTSISHVTWVIMAYNQALIVTALAVIPFARRLEWRRALIAGLVLFGLASIGCGVANSMSALVPLRSLQGVGGGVLLCASLPMFASTARPGDSPFNGWSAAAAIGVAVGPAAGGVLTQIFDWRAIFLAQAPVAALAAVLVLAVHTRPGNELKQKPDHRPATLDPLTANVGLALLSAGLICALFLVVLELIDVWLLSPIAAAAVVTTIPLATAIAERRLRGSSRIALGAAGSALVAAGLIGLSFVTHRELGWLIVTLALVGAGLGLAFPGLTTAALRSGGPAAARAGKTVAARDAGIVLGLLVLTPVFVHQLSRAPNQALPAATKAVLAAPLPSELKFTLAPGLVADYKNAPQSELPDFGPTFAKASAHATPSQRAALRDLHNRLDSIIQRAATSAFKLPLRYGAILAIVVLPLLGVHLIRSTANPAQARRRRVG
jgi:predicted MFS family arabinose efflux permease